MPALKNAKKERYVQNLVAGMSQRKAYRDAYPSSARWKDKTVDNRASELFSGEVLGRYEEILDEQKQRALMSRYDKRKMLAEIALDVGNDPGDRMKAIDIDNKMEGEYMQKVDLFGDMDLSIKIDYGEDDAE